ncbi:MAG TPA: FtsX-like permease family protein, partial [Mycobacterium sp.]|nr:FtsX-like permease family protein [Mycobacterium sp.]
VLIRFSHEVGTSAAVRSVIRIMNTLNAGPGGGAGIQSYRVLLPAEIINYKTMGSIPTFLAAGLAAGAVFAVGLTLAASVRRRRRELALFKTLGFTRRQLQLTVGWQATVTATIGAIIGLPVGIVLGRSLWDLFAHELYVVPAPSVSAVDMVLVVVGAIVLANLVAAIPGRIAARTPAALVLRAD